ncbi:hypothetical protein [Streptomyces sp. MA25(2023)]|uniref:hypothetical protein n=1 Tax=Streptomyces TaxID=1883 RepID=UPI0025AEF4A5|nr:hypothetical protein [Streptomyces sp. MA25(2023)]MDN3253965.1 hypothetical protein [Streptomyces sp. MA25(2023)]
MTQSGQGEEPSPRQAREGIVLPSDGGEPLLPGLTGASAPAGPAPAPASAPPAAQPWDRPWGPEQQQSPAPDQGWPTPPDAQPWGSPEAGAQPSAAHAWPAQGGPAQSPGALPPQAGPGPLPPEGAQAGPGYEGPAGGQTYGGSGGGQAYGGSFSQAYGGSSEGQAYAGQPGEQAYGGASGSEAYGGRAPGGSAGGQAHGAQPPYGQQGQYGQTGAFGQAGPHGQPPAAVRQPAAAPLPPADEGATQYLPPVGAAPADEGATQYIPPVPAAGNPADEGATQYIPPVSPGALPPERPARPQHPESTQFLGTAPQYPAQSTPGYQPAPAGPDAEATQFIAPVPGGPAAPAPYGGAPGGDEGRQPPAEFDSLFRSAPGADGPASSTQQMPRFDEPRAAHPGGPSAYATQGPGGGGGRRRGGHDDGGRGGRGGRTGSRVPLLAAVGVGIAVVGIGAGAMMANGGKEEDKGDNQPVSATAPVSESASAPASPSVDPAREQAVALDKLLAESGTGRTTVINAVADVKSCDNLPQAAKDLREAAKQRTGLVTSLSELSVDKLPRHTELTTALTKAWQASASADNHYAAWADRTAGKKGCKKGKAATQPKEANRESGTASTEKAKAAKLWNAIAKQYGLTERGPTQL